MAVCLPRECCLVVAVLGVWRAGMAYVPLEPSFPLPRQRFLLEDSEAMGSRLQKSLVLGSCGGHAAGLRAQTGLATAKAHREREF